MRFDAGAFSVKGKAYEYVCNPAACIDSAPGLSYYKKRNLRFRCNDCSAILAAYHYTLICGEIFYSVKNGIFDSVATIALQSLLHTTTHWYPRNFL